LSQKYLDACDALIRLGTTSNLQSDTVYYYLIYTTDQSGNVSVTWPASFHTNN